MSPVTTQHSWGAGPQRAARAHRHPSAAPVCPMCAARWGADWAENSHELVARLCQLIHRRRLPGLPPSPLGLRSRQQGRPLAHSLLHHVDMVPPVPSANGSRGAPRPSRCLGSWRQGAVSGHGKIYLQGVCRGEGVSRRSFGETAKSGEGAGAKACGPPGCYGPIPASSWCPSVCVTRTYAPGLMSTSGVCRPCQSGALRPQRWETRGQCRAPVGMPPCAWPGMLSLPCRPRCQHQGWSSQRPDHRRTL